MGLMTIGYKQPLSAEAEALAVAAAEKAACAAVDHWAREVSAHALMEEIAGRLGVDRDLVWNVLCGVPDNLLTLLDSPQGWSALMGYVSGELGAVAADFKPVVH